MKKIIFILSLLVSFVNVFGQPPIIRGSNANTIFDNRLGAIKNFIPPIYDDTTQANLDIGLDSLGALIFSISDNSYWYRAGSPKRWLQVGSPTALESSNSILVSGDGSPPNPYIPTLIASQQSNNAVQIFPDGVFVPSQIQNGLIEGGRVVHRTGMTYTVQAARYAINGVIYTSPETDVTLDNADPTDPRFDAFIVTTSSTADNITGTPDPTNPQNPSYDPLTQLPLTFVQVLANQTEPVFCRDSIYYPNNGNTWTAFPSNATRINVTSTTDPYSVTQAIAFTAAQNNDQLRMEKGATISVSTYSVMVLGMKSLGVWASTSRISIRFYNVLTPIGIAVVIGDNTPYGFNSSNTATYQTPIIPLDNFGNVTGATNILITVQTTGANTIGFRLDDWELLGCDGTPPPTSGSFWNTTGNQEGRTLFGGTLDNQIVQFLVNNTNFMRLQTGANGTIHMQGINPGISFQLGSFAAADYFIQRIANTNTLNVAAAGIISHTIQGVSVYNSSAANGHIWSSTAGAQQMLLAPTGAFRLHNYGDNLFTGTATRWLAVDVNGNVIEQAPPVSSITAENGLTANTSTNVRLGGTLLQNTTIDNANLYTLNVTGQLANTIFTVTNSGTGTALAGISSVNAGIYGQASLVSGGGDEDAAGVFGNATGDTPGVYGQSTSGVGVSGFALGANYGAHFSSNYSSTNAVETVLRLDRTSSGGAGANGIGGAIDFYLETASNSRQLAGKVSVQLTTATQVSRVSRYELSLYNAGSIGRKFAVAGSGAITADTYGSGTHVGTPTFTLQVDATGNIIEGAVGAGTGDVLKVGTPVNNQVGVWTGDPTIEGDAALTFTGGALTIGLAGTTLGQLVLSGNTAQTVTLRTLATAGNYTLTFPANDGGAGEVLSTDGSGGLSWIAAGSVGTVTNVTWTGGIVSIANPTTAPAFTVAGTSGGGVYFSSTSTWASTALLAANSIMIGGGAGAAYLTTTTAAGILTFIGTPSSANLRSAVTDETGTGSLYFQSGDLGTPIAGLISAGVTIGDVTMNLSGTDAAGDMYYRNGAGILIRLPIGSSGQILRAGAGGLPEYATISGSGTLTNFTFTNANGFIGSVLNPTTSPNLTIGTNLTGMLSGNGTAMAAVTSSTVGQVLRVTGANVFAFGALDLSDVDAVTNALPAINGGTGLGSGYTAGQILWANSSTTLTRGFMNGTANQINVVSNVSGITVSHAFNPTEQTLTSGAVITWNIINGGNAVLTLNNTGAILANPSNVVPGYTYTLRIIQGSGGSRTITTWTNVDWANGTLPTLATAVGAEDVIRLYAVTTARFIGTHIPNVQ